MSLSRAAILKLFLSLVLALNVFSGGTAKADAPPAGTAVQLQTYGTLPVMVVNLTRSAINYNVSTNQAAVYTNGNFPIAIGLPGWYYVQGNGSTRLFSNPTTPAIPPSGATNASLQPAVETSANTVNANYSFMTAFNLFPSWSGSVSYNGTSYYAFSYPNGGNSLGSTPGPSSSPLPRYIATSQTAYAQSMANPSLCSLNLNVLSPAGETNPPGYIININSLGGQTSAYQPPSYDKAPTDWFDVALTILVDIDTLAEPNPITVADMLYGIYSTFSDIIEASESPNTTNQPYPAKYKGINVSAALAANTGGATLSLTGGANNYLVYETKPANPTATLPLDQQNTLLVFTWRASPANTSTTERNAADTLIVVVINKGVYAASQVQQYLNNPFASQATTAKLQYKPTKQQAADSLKILGILTAIAKKDPQDAQRIIDMFGVHGQYANMQHDPNAAARKKEMLKEVFEKHRQEIPEIQYYLAKLAQQ